MINLTYTKIAVPEQLVAEIQAAGILRYPDAGFMFYGITITNSTTLVLCNDAIPDVDVAKIDAVVAAHIGVPIVTIAAPMERDGRPIVVTAPNPEGWKSYYTGAGDKLAPREIGNGDRLRLSFAGPGTQAIKIQFSEPVEMHDGQMTYSPPVNWTFDDVFDFFVVIPATPSVANGAGTGNANKYPIGGGANMFIPAAGNGAWDIDLATAVPVPMDTPAGFYEANRDSGAVSVGVHPGKSAFTLLDVPLKVYFARKIPMGNSLGIFDVDAYKTQWVSERWLLCLEVIKASAGAGECAGWILAYRRNPQ